MASRGPGRLAEPGVVERWGGRRAAEYVAKTLEVYGRQCWLCGMPGADSADHVIPISRGGAVYDLANLAPAHRACNYGRGNRPATDFELVLNGTDFFSRE